MGKKTTIALLVCGTYLFTNSMLNNKYQRINEKLEHITKHIVTVEWETTIQMQREVIDSLLLDQMDLGAKLDSCIIVND